MVLPHLFAIWLAFGTADPAVAQAPPASRSAESAEAAAVSKAFAVESLILMAGELEAAIEANRDDLTAASPYLDLIYLRYRGRGDQVAEQLRRASLAAAGPGSTGLTEADAAAIARFRLLPEETLGRILSGQFGSDRSQPSAALSVARRLGRTLHGHTRSMIAGGETRDAPASRVIEETRSLAEEMTDLLERNVVADDVDERASVRLVADAMVMSPGVIAVQVARAKPEPGVALTVAYSETLRRLSEDTAEAERRLRLAAPGPDRALAIERLQPRLVQLSDRAHAIGLALSEANPAALPPAALAAQREEIGRVINLTTLRARIEQ